MRLGPGLGILCAIGLHAGFILFGGLLFEGATRDGLALQDVELLSSVAAEEPEPEPPPEETEELAEETEEPPDAAELIRNLDAPTPESAPALDAASLSALEAALDGKGAGNGGDFSQALDFASGGRIGGTGRGMTGGDGFESAFSMAEIDQKPRAIAQPTPLYPSQMRGKKVDAVVTVVFVVDPTGRVVSPRVEKSSHDAFDGPTLNAIKRWKFEPAIRGGERVACKMRVPIRFPPT